MKRKSYFSRKLSIKRKKLLIALLIILMLIVLLYKYNRNIEINSLTDAFGSELNLPKVKKTDKLKIIINVCGDCKGSYYTLPLWTSWLEKYSDKIDVITYYHMTDSTGFESHIKDSLGFNSTLIYDNDLVFFKENKLDYGELNFHTMLLDCNNRVVLLGNPVDNIHISELYIKEIENRLRRKEF